MELYNELTGRLNVICANEHYESDESLSQKINRVYDEFMYKDPTLLANHNWLNTIIARRVKEYCNYHKIKLEDYKGPLPFRMVIVHTKKQTKVNQYKD